MFVVVYVYLPLLLWRYSKKISLHDSFAKLKRIHGSVV